MCIGIIRNNSLAGWCAQAESNPGHWAHHALLHMATDCVNHSATRAGPFTIFHCVRNSYNHQLWVLLPVATTILHYVLRNPPPSYTVQGSCWHQKSSIFDITFSQTMWINYSVHHLYVTELKSEDQRNWCTCRLLNELYRITNFRCFPHPVVFLIFQIRRGLAYHVMVKRVNIILHDTSSTIYFSFFKTTHRIHNKRTSR